LITKKANLVLIAIFIILKPEILKLEHFTSMALLGELFVTTILTNQQLKFSAVQSIPTTVQLIGQAFNYYLMIDNRISQIPLIQYLWMTFNVAETKKVLMSVIT
jgi:hypothetical protein